MNILESKLSARLSIDPSRLGTASIATSSAAGSRESIAMAEAFQSIEQASIVAAPATGRNSVEERLYDALAAFKVRTATVAMHLDREWRDRLFRQLDSLLDASNWVSSDVEPKLASFATFLRMIIAMNPLRRPGLAAASDGILIASWTNGEDRLSIECLSGDRIRWIVSRPVAGEVEYAGGISDVQRLPAILAPYNPERLFGDANHVHSR